MKPKPSGYHGHPKIMGLTGITPRIQVKRLTGMVPHFLQVTAKPTSWEGPSLDGGQFGPDRTPWRDLEFRWTCTDAAGREAFPHPVAANTQGSGLPETVDPAMDQTGPEAVFKFDQPGEYEITLTARGHNGSEMIVASTSTLLQCAQYHIFHGHATGGTYTLSVGGQTTEPLAYDLGGEDVAEALEALSSVGQGNVRSMPWAKDSAAKEGPTVEFIGDLAGVAVELTANFGGLTGTNGTPSVIQRIEGATDTKVTVTDFLGETRYADSEYDGSNGEPDGSIERPYNTMGGSGWPGFLRGGSNRRVLIKRGSVFSGGMNFGWNYAVSHNRIGAYGDGPDPIIKTTSPLEFAQRRGLNVDDWVFSNIILDGQGQQPRVVWLFADAMGSSSMPMAKLRDLYFDRVTFRGTTGSLVRFSTHDLNCEIATRMGYYRCDYIHEHDGIPGKTQGMLGHTSGDLFIFGGSFIGGEHEGQLYRDHHFYVGTYEHALYRWINFGMADKSYCMRLNSPTGVGVVRYILADGCHVTGTENGIAFSNAHYDPSVSKFDHCLVQNCAIHYTPGTEGNTRWAISARPVIRLTVRDNLIWNHQDVIHGGEFTRISAYRNAAFAALSTDRNFNGIYRLEPGAASNGDPGGEVMLNMIARPDSGRVLSMRWSDAATTIFDHNLYWSPAGESGLVFQDTTGSGENKSFSQWQAAGFDENGVVSDPGWLDPGNGDFQVPHVGPTSYSISAPESLDTGESVTIMLTADADASGIQVTLNASDGSINPNPVTFLEETATVALTAPSTEGPLTITMTNNGGLVDPSPIAIEVQALPVSSEPEQPEPEPVLPGLLSHISHSATKVTVAWTQATGGVGPIAAQLEMSADSGTTWAKVTGAVESPATVSGLVPNTEYHFRVRFEDLGA